MAAKCPLCGGKTVNNECMSCGYRLPDEDDISSLYNYDPSDYPQPQEKPTMPETGYNYAEPEPADTPEIKVRENPYAENTGGASPYANNNGAEPNNNNGNPYANFSPYQPQQNSGNQQQPYERQHVGRSRQLFSEKLVAFAAVVFRSFGRDNIVFHNEGQH